MLFGGSGGAEGIRTPDPHNAIVVLYQLSYDPNQKVDERLVVGTRLSNDKVEIVLPRDS